MRPTGLWAVAAACALGLAGCKSEPPQPKALHLFAGAGLRTVVDEAIDAFQRETGATVATDYGGSAEMLARAELSPDGDLFLPGDRYYVELAETKGTVADKENVGYFVPVLLVAKGNPKGIASVKDLARSDVKVGLGDPEVAAVGRTSLEIFARNGLSAAEMSGSRVSHSPTVNLLGVWVDTDRVDAAIVWDAVAAQYPDAEAVPIPLDKNVVSRVAVAVLKQSKDPALARKFVDFLLSDEGKTIFRRNHYRVEPPAE